MHGLKCPKCGSEWMHTTDNKTWFCAVCETKK